MLYKLFGIILLHAIFNKKLLQFVISQGWATFRK